MPGRDGDVQPVANPFKVGLDDMMNLTEAGSLTALGGVQGLAQALSSSLSEGISTTSSPSVADREAVFGRNVVPRTPPKSLIRLFFESFNDFTLMILIAAAVVSIILSSFFGKHPEEEWVDGTAILIAVLIVACVTAVNDWSKEKQFRKLDDKNKPYNTVLRDGTLDEYVVDDILVGDVVIVKTGDFIPCDGVFIEGNNILIDESAMTGESDQVAKDAGRPFFLSGTKCTEGSGRMLVVGVGVNTEMGRTMAAIDEAADDSQTPLEAKLDKMAKQIGLGGLVVGILVFILLMIYWIVDNVEDGDFTGDDGREVLDFFIVGVVILVVAIPEGLPLAVTISLAYSTMKMFKDQNLVRTLAACETMGGATNICSDKTGTLTQNKMTAVQGWIAGKFFPDLAAVQVSPEVSNLVCSGIAINSSVYKNRKDDGTEELVGNKTEIALLNGIKHFGHDWEDLRKSQEAPDNVVYPFNSAVKTMSTVVTIDNHRRIYTKGAPDYVIKTCTMVIDSEGKHQPLDDQTREQIEESLNNMASSGLRTLCLAYADFEQDTSEKFDSPEAPSKDLTCIAIMGIKDPLRPEVPDAVAQCKTAGIFVRMVTGDNIVTAKTIARECGILTDGVAIEGREFREMSPEARLEVLPNLQVMARSNPTDKLLLVESLIELGEVVSVTGDGTNDAAALSRADVGLSMGIAGTQVAKDASDIVILDDNFSSIVKAVMWGRTVYDNIRKFLQFQLTINLVALTIATLGAASRRPDFPLTPVQMLWVNLIMDTFAALALGTEEPTPDLLTRQPYGRHDRLVNRQMMRNILGHGALQFIVLSTIMFDGHNWYSKDIVDGSNEHYTLLFNTFVWFQIFNEINSRKLHDDSPGTIFTGISTNVIFICILIGTAIAQALIVELVGSFADTKPQTAGQWFTAIGLGFLSIPMGVIMRLIPVKNNTKVQNNTSPPALAQGTV